MIEGKERKAFLIILLLIIMVPTFFFGSRVILSVNLHWGIDVGDEFSYHILEEGWYLDGEGITGNRTQYSAINDTYIIVTIQSLPDLSLYPIESMFSTNVIQFMKIGIGFENGSALPYQYGMIETVLSACILPLGGWILIDSFYQDTDYLGSQFSTYYAYQDSNVFVFGFHMYDIDLDVSYEAVISQDNGMPSALTYNRVHGMDYDHTLILELLDT